MIAAPRGCHHDAPPLAASSPALPLPSVGHLEVLHARAPAGHGRAAPGRPARAPGGQPVHAVRLLPHPPRAVRGARRRAVVPQLLLGEPLRRGEAGREGRGAGGKAASTRTRPHAAPPSNAVVVASPRFPSPVFPSSHSSLQARFPDWPIADPVGLLRAVLDAWRSELTKTEEPKGSPDDAYATLGIAVGADEKEIRKAYRKLAIKYVRRTDGARGGLPAAAARPCLHHACHGRPLPSPSSSFPRHHHDHHHHHVCSTPTRTPRAARPLRRSRRRTTF